MLNQIRNTVMRKISALESEIDKGGDLRYCQAMIDGLEFCIRVIDKARRKPTRTDKQVTTAVSLLRKRYRGAEFYERLHRYYLKYNLSEFQISLINEQ